jgi:hypothetical protein
LVHGHTILLFLLLFVVFIVVVFVVVVVMSMVTGEWRKLHYEELNDLHSSLNTVRVIKSGRMRWAVHVARMGGEERRTQGFGGET